MKKVFDSIKSLEQRASDLFCISEDVMIENAAAALEQQVRTAVDAIPSVQEEIVVFIACGSGNNGADGYALARRIQHEFIPVIQAVAVPKTESCIKQAQSAKNAGVLSKDVDSDAYLRKSSIVVDCIFGTGFHGRMDEATADLIGKMNERPYRIACDVPSGIDHNGNVSSGVVFNADVTVTMGAYKTALFSDEAKAHCGSIVCAGIGVHDDLFSADAVPDAYILEKSDMMLPFRKNSAAHKGMFGHAAVVMGDKQGAAVIAGTAALSFGAGLVTLVESVPQRIARMQISPELMVADSFPMNTTAVLLGSGLGRSGDAGRQLEYAASWLDMHPSGGLVLDADVFYCSAICAFLEKTSEKLPDARIVLTPHPKEFQSLLQLCGWDHYSVEAVVDRRMEFARQFGKKFGNTVLVLKGADTLIVSGGHVYISTEGCVCLAKAGSGDVLAGMICALLAQGYTAQDAACTGVLAHGTASQRFGNGFGMTPFKLIESAATLK